MANKTHVYFAQKKSNGLIKIGCTINPIRRVISLKSAIGEDLELIFVILNSDPNKEKEIHKKFNEIRTYGEWFRPEKILIDYINELKDKNPTYENDLKNLKIRKRETDEYRIIAFRVSKSLKEQVIEAADDEGLSISSWVRRVIINEIERRRGEDFETW